MFLIPAFVLILAEPAISPPVTTYEVPDTRSPLTNSDRVVVTCPDGGVVGAEFIRERQIVTVVGIAGFSRAASGHCYFNLKDEQGQVRCAMFKRAASLVDFVPRDGQVVAAPLRDVATYPAADYPTLQGSVTVTVIQRLPNGNLVVQGQKNMRLNQGDELVQIQGIVRPADINPDNTISSGKVADARIAYGGRGAIAQSNSMGWLGRFFNSPIFPN